MENIDLTNKKLDNWGSKLNDFKAENELTIEITLNEYRELVKGIATKEYDIEKANKDRYTREEENRKLKTKNEQLSNELLEYVKKYGKLELDDSEEIED